MENKTICSAFWKHTNIRPGNRIYPCCRFKSPVTEFDGDISKVLNSETYIRLRDESAQGRKISGCEKCYYEEEIGHKSLRQEFNEQYDTETVELKYLEIGIDNLCNMACDGCNSEYSTKWIEKEKTMYGKAKHDYLSINEVSAVPDSVEKILFLGGEPLLTKRHLDILKLHNNPKICRVFYNTNASTIPDQKCLDVWKNFDDIKFIASLDGLGEVNEQVRHGSKWTETVSFLDWCRDNDYELSINSVIHRNNLFNVLDMKEFVDDYTDDWYVNVLTYPRHLDIKTHDKETLDAFLIDLEKADIPNKEFIRNHILQN